MSQISHIFRRAFSSNATSHSIYKENDLQKLVETFKKHTQNSNFRKKATFYEYTVQRLSDANASNLIEEILEDQKQYMGISNEGFSVRLISLYGKSGMFDHAIKVFDEMPQRKVCRTVKSFNALLGACVNSKKFDGIDVFFLDLPKKLGIRPNVVSYNTLIKGFCKMGDLDKAVSMLGEMEKEGMEAELITFNILLDGLYKKGRFLDGEMMWSVMEKRNVVPDIISCNTRLYGLVLEKRMEEAVEWVEEIRNKGLKLDVFTYNFLFKGLCGDNRYLAVAKRFYIEMLKTKCLPDRATFAMLLPFACDTEDFWFGARLCRGLFYRRCRLNRGDLLQRVIDGLVKQGNVNESELLVRLGRESKHSCYHSLKMSKFG